MTRAEIIQMIKDAWVRALMDVKDIREDIAETYSAWVRSLIQQAAPELSGTAMQTGGGEAQGGGGGGGEAAAASGGAMPGAAEGV